MKSVFGFADYREFLSDYVANQPKGAKLRLAAIVDCQPGYVSQILGGTANLSLEQAEKLANYLGWDGASTHYFLLLVSFARAGTPGLRKHLQTEIHKLRGESAVLKNRFKPEKVLSIEDQATFYSSWHYGAIHVCVSIPGCDSEPGIASFFHLPEKRVNEVVQFLTRSGLITRARDGRLSIGSTQVYIGADSPLISKHHANWRMQAIAALDRYKDSHLHYSSVITISQADVARVRELMAKTIEDIRAIVRPSKDEACFSYALDLFEVGERK
jgi:uncharacterized protein (TIGR02147 family)